MNKENTVPRHGQMLSPYTPVYILVDVTRNQPEQTPKEATGNAKGSADKASLPQRPVVMFHRVVIKVKDCHDILFILEKVVSPGKVPCFRNDVEKLGRN